jgi:transcriptional regulator NrdR family protein
MKKQKGRSSMKVRRDEIGKPSGTLTLVPAGMAVPVVVGVVTRNDTRNLYGATENRRACHACGSAKSTVESVRRLARLTIRYRLCSDCGAKRTTQEVLAL